MGQKNFNVKKESSNSGSESSGTVENIGVSSGLSKLDGAMAVIDLETQILKHDIGGTIQEDLNTAKEQALQTVNVFNDINFALASDLISPSLMNDGDLSALANYLLNGDKPTKDNMVEDMHGNYYAPTDQDKTTQFQKIDAEIQKQKSKR